MEALKNNSGTYLLELELSAQREIDVGALGRISFKSGRYVYVGRASKNLRQRLERHLRTEKKVRWHVDYLLMKSQLKQIHVSPGIIEEEVAQHFLGDLRCEAINGFGASDSVVASHLFRISSAEAGPVLQEICLRYNFSAVVIGSDRKIHYN